MIRVRKAKRLLLTVITSMVVASLGPASVGAASMGPAFATGSVPPDTIAPGTVPSELGPDGTTAPIDPAAAVPGIVATTVPEGIGADSGAATQAPELAPSAPLIQVPSGCPAPPVALIVFIGTLVAKDHDTGRFRIDQTRAGGAAPYIVAGQIDIRYDDETQYLTVGDQYLVGAAPEGFDIALRSKVRETDLLFGGNAVIGLTEKNSECPPIEDPVRTLHIDGSEVESSLFTGLKGSGRDIVLAFAQPLGIAFAALLALAAVRWLFTSFFVAVRRAADGEPLTSFGNRKG